MLFTSKRERRLWLWTLAVMVAIYATLGPARSLADALRERHLLETSFALVLLVVVVAVVAQWVKQRPGWREIGVALGVALAYLTAFLRIGTPEERTHLIEYGIVAALIHQALLERVRNGRQVPAPALLTMILTGVLGTVDEIIQAVLPNRVFDFRDVFFNAFAGFMVVAARLALVPQRGPGWRVWFLWLMAGAIGWGWGVYWGWFTPDEPKTLESIPPVILAGYLGVVVGGMAIGVLQWLAVRRHLAGAGRWVLASVGSAIVVGVIMFGVGAVDPGVGWLAGVSAYGMVLGTFQWLILRGQIPLSGWWVPASTVGWGVGMPVGDSVGPPGLGAVYGVITGTVLVWLLRRRGPAAQPQHGSSGAGQ